jgi:3'(2'), 5'-bisphosphate nucleotidase
MAEYLKAYDNFEMVSVGSSLKFCLVAEGLADIYPRLGPTMEWDTGAGQCIAEAAGATVTDMEGETFKYNTKDSLLNGYFIVQ